MMTSSELAFSRIPKLLRDFALSLAESGPSEDDLVAAAASSCKELLQAQQCSVWIEDSVSQKLKLKAATGYTNLGDDYSLIEYPISGGSD